MRSYKNLYQRLCSFENLYKAFRQAARGKYFRFQCANFSYDREREIFLIQEKLLSRTYRHGPYREFKVADPKERQVKAADFPDRVVHHALCNIIGPIFEARFIHDSFACRKGKGNLAALLRCEKFVKRFKDGYFLKTDISKYFYSVDHAVLLEIIKRKIADKEVIWLIDRILSSSEDARFRAYFPGDDLFALSRPTGIPIGNLTSQLFANIYLNELDQFVKQELRCKHYLRYMDDVLLFAADKESLRRALERIDAFLARNLRLRVHPVKRHISPVRCGVDWVGYRVYPRTVRIRRKNIFRFRARNRRLRSLYHQGKISLQSIRNSIVSFCGYTHWADAGKLTRQLLEMEVF